jgi:hypothetical protein
MTWSVGKREKIGENNPNHSLQLPYLKSFAFYFYNYELVLSKNATHK